MGKTSTGQTASGAEHAQSSADSGKCSVEELMRRTQHGDVVAFGALYDHLAPLVYGICLCVISDPELALETSQEALLKMWRLAPRFEIESGTIEDWASTIAHRSAVDCVRSQEARRRWKAIAEPDTPLGVQNFDPSESTDVKDGGRVSEALEALSTSQQQAIGLAYYGGLTYREVAETLGIRPETAKTRIRDGLIRLR